MFSFYRPHARITAPEGGDLVTRQEFKDECDINNILNQFKLTGIITNINQNQPLYADLPNTMDYQESLSIITQAETAFDTLPSVVRDYFNGDPAQFLAAFADPEMGPKLREWGLLKPLPPVQDAPVVPPTGVSPVSTPSPP